MIFTIFVFNTRIVFAEVFSDENSNGYSYTKIEIEDFIGGDVYAKSMSIPGGYSCTSDSRIPNFCSELKSRCNNDCNEVGLDPLSPEYHSGWPICNYGDACDKAVGDVYNEKMEEILQDEIDQMFTSAGLDVDAANDAIESCAGELSCINKIIQLLQNDGSYAAGSSSGINYDEPITASSLSDIINSYGSQNSQDQSPINSLSNDPTGISGKMQGPTVDVTFLPSLSVNGSSVKKIIASASAGFFKTIDSKDLFYTWYLKREGCELTDPDYPTGTKIEDDEVVNISQDTDNEKLKSCDHDEDKIITVNDWKIAAARIIVSGSYDRSQASYNQFPDKMTSQSSGFVAEPKIIDGTDGDDGWRKGFLEDGNGDVYQTNSDNEDVENCYVKASKSGLIYELRNVESDFSSNECPTGYHRACVSDESASCDIANPEYSQTAAAAAAAQTPPQVYTIPRTIKQDFSACAVSSEKSSSENEDSSSEVSCSINGDLELKNYRAEVSCGSGKFSLCIKDGSSYASNGQSANVELENELGSVLGVIVGTEASGTDDTLNEKMCSAVAKISDSTSDPKIFLPNTNPLFTTTQEKCSVLVDKFINGEEDSTGKTIITGNANLKPKCTFKKAENLCQHLFPILPSNIKKDNGKRAISGDGEFNLKEKEFWWANPSVASTINKQKDEERVIGRGVDTFEWIYQSGDKLGVVVEGETSLQTDHLDGSYKRMWAFSKNKCEALDDLENSSSIDENRRGFYIETKGILTANIDLNNCLEENLLDPDTQGVTSLKVDLVAKPENPINDEGGKGDVLIVSSTASNLQNPEGLLYKWNVQKSKDGSKMPSESTSWIDITSSLNNSQSISASEMEGINKDEININLNLKNVDEGMQADSFNGIFYLKIKLKITGTAADGNQISEGSVIVRVKQQENEMLVYPVTAAYDGVLSLNKGLSGQSLELCSNTDEKTRCFIGKNQIIGLEVQDSSSSGALSNFSWKVNGNEIECTSSISASCPGTGKTMFIPILGNEGESINVVAAALNSKKESIEVSRQFVIGSSQLAISPVGGACSINCLNSNSVCPKYLGHYNGIDGSKSPDCSHSVFESKRGTVITLKTNGQTGFNWSVDGQIISDFQNKNEIQVPIDKQIGDSYTIGLTTQLLPENVNQLNNIRRALYKNWGISPEEEMEKSQSASIQINIAGDGDQVAVAATNKNFAASLITHLPQQFMFLFKITITSITLLAFMTILFALIPGDIERKTEYM